MPDPPSSARHREPALSARETETLRLLAEGRSTAEIAAAMSISPNTVRTRIHRLRAKLGVTDRQQVVPRARHLGLHMAEQAPVDGTDAGRVPRPRAGGSVTDRSGRGQGDCPRQTGDEP
jgi:DNA-binding CsgD family transcriptional regulator